MVRAASHPVVHIGAEVEHLAGVRLLDSHLDGQERRVVDADAALFHRCDEVVLVAFALEDGGEKLDQGRPPDRGAEVEPGAVGGDPHVEIATERRIPQVYRRRTLAGRLLGGARYGFDPARRGLHLFRHDWRYPTQGPRGFAREIVIRATLRASMEKIS